MFAQIFIPESVDADSKMTKEEVEELEEDAEKLLSRVPEDVSQLQDLYLLTQGCLLLLMLKQHFKDLFGFTDA